METILLENLLYYITLRSQRVGVSGLETRLDDGWSILNSLKQFF